MKRELKGLRFLFLPETGRFQMGCTHLYEKRSGIKGIFGFLQTGILKFGRWVLRKGVIGDLPVRGNTMRSWYLLMSDHNVWGEVRLHEAMIPESTLDTKFPFAILIAIWITVEGVSGNHSVLSK